MEALVTEDVTAMLNPFKLVFGSKLFIMAMSHTFAPMMGNKHVALNPILKT